MLFKVFMKIFSVYDSKAEAYMQPFFADSVGQAERSFIEACNDPSTSLCKYPDDFTLFEFGDFCEFNGKFTLRETPRSLGLAIGFKKQSQVSLDV